VSRYGIPLRESDVQAFDYPNALVVCQRGPIACVANAERYDLVDLERGKTTLLFPIMSNVDISDDGTPVGPTLPPLIASVGEEDFLVTTGTSLQDPAIGMFIDLFGEAVRGTLMFSNYPRALSTSVFTVLETDRSRQLSLYIRHDAEF
jgi:vacuolar protein sorting-associated protein 3